MIRLDRTPANAYDYAFLRELAAAVDEARLDEGIGGVMVESALPAFFSGGADLGAFAAGTARRRAMTCLLGQEALLKFERTPVPFVAAICGHALGGGLEIALACDLRYAWRGDFRLGLPEVGFGLFPGSGGTQRLPRLIGLSRALDLILTGRTLDPEQAHRVGLVDRLFDTPGECREAARLRAGG